MGLRSSTWFDTIDSHLKPHVGYIEQVEIDWMPHCDSGTLPPHADILRWAAELLSAMDMHGRPMRVDSQRTVAYLSEAGFVDIKEEVIKVPISGWSDDPVEKERGRWLALALIKGLSALTLGPLTRINGRSRAEVDHLAEKVRMEVANRKIRAQCYV